MNLFELSVKIDVDTNDVEKGVEDTKEQLKGLGDESERTTERLGAADIAVGELIASMAKWGASAIKNMAQTGIMYNAQIETYTAALTTALGSEAEAAAAIEQIKTDAAKTPYSVDGLVAANSLLIQSGESAEDARLMILALTDAVSASGGGNAELQRMAQNLQQIKNVGKATQQDIKQFAIAGIDIYGVLADYTGKTTEEVKELDITYELLTSALQAAAIEGGRFYQANALQAETLNGQLSTLQDNWSNFLGNAFSGVANVLSNTVLPAVNSFFDSLDPSDASILMLEFTGTIAGLGIATLAASESGKKLLSTFKAFGSAGLIAGGVMAVTAAIIDNVKTMEEYTDSLVISNGTTEDMAANLEVLRQKEVELKTAMDSGWASEQTMRDYDMVRNAIALQIQAQEEANAVANEAVSVQNDVSEATESTTDTMSKQEGELVSLRQAYVDTFMAARTEVQSWYSLFDKADEIQAASLDDMASNIQSQIDFNSQYQQSLETLAEAGYGELANQIQTLGIEGANYAAALSEALSQGNAEQVESIAQMLDTLTGTQNTLADTITQTSGEFDALIETIDTAIAEPFQVIIQDNAADIAANVSSELGSIPDEDVFVNVITRYSNQGQSNIDGTHAQGLYYVPFDGYIAELHKGERVLTAAEASALNAQKTSGGNMNNVASLYSQSPSQEIVTNVTLELDGAVLARKMYRHNQTVSNDRGSGFVVGAI